MSIIHSKNDRGHGLADPQDAHAFQCGDVLMRNGRKRAAAFELLQRHGDFFRILRGAHHPADTVLPEKFTPGFRRSEPGWINRPARLGIAEEKRNPQIINVPKKNERVSLSFLARDGLVYKFAYGIVRCALAKIIFARGEARCSSQRGPRVHRKAGGA